MIFGKYKTERKIEKLFDKLDVYYNKVVHEAGSVTNLSIGVKLGYTNFGNFVDTSYSIVDMVKIDLNSKKNNLTNHVDIIKRLKKYTDTINYVTDVSEYSIEQLKFVKKRIRGTENLVFCMCFETDEECENALERLTCGDSEVSRRNFVGLDIVKVK